MNPPIRASRTAALRMLSLALVAAFLSWALYVAGRYVDLTLSIRNDVWPGSTEHASPAPYFTVVALAVLGLGALLAKRKLARLRAEEGPRSALVAPVAGFANLVLVVAAVLAALMVLTLALGGLFTFETEPEPLARVVNVYVPIALYTALIVTLILVGFVFSPAPRKREPLEETPLQPVAQEEQRDEGSDAPGSRRTTALAYTTPIVAAAIALVLGLIVYDLTQTVLQSWIWVLILTIVATGVLAGTLFARRSETASAPAVGISKGAKYLNFVLSILFAVFASGLSLGYGAAAVYSLNVAPNLWIYVYGEEELYVESDPDAIELTDPAVTLDGYDLRAGSEVSVVLEPGGENVFSATVDRDRWLNGEWQLPENLAPGEYELVAQAVAPDNEPVEISLRFEIVEAGLFVFPDGNESSFTTETNRMLPASADWVFRDLLPSGVLLMLAIAVTAGTITVRNREA